MVELELQFPKNCSLKELCDKKSDDIKDIFDVMSKKDLFKTVIIDGVLPRKTFSMGEAKEKRFYMECKNIS